MSKHDDQKNRAVALKYDPDSGAPIVLASGMGYLAERMVELAADSGVPIYEDNSLATLLSQLQLGQAIPPDLYKAIVEIYIYFLHFDTNDPDKFRRERAERLQRERASSQEPAVEAPVAEED
ncbi:MAG: EscU/YscU/HrcU family type III secretion system export apparatus switch protein [Eubacteriales bacterium]